MILNNQLVTCLITNLLLDKIDILAEPSVFLMEPLLNIISYYKINI